MGEGDETGEKEEEIVVEGDEIQGGMKNSKRLHGSVRRSLNATPKKVAKASWFLQFRSALKKNILLISRRPLIVVVMSLSSCLSVLLSYAIVGPKNNFADTPLADCGIVDPQFYFNATYDYEHYEKVYASHNEAWRGGLAVAIMGLGPLFFGIGVFLYMLVEFQTKLVGVLRGLGLRESAFWASWWVPFIIMATLNALFGAVTASILSSVIHAFESTDFGIIFASFFFLNISLTAASMFVTVIVGTGGNVLSAFFILVMIAVAFVPWIYMGADATSYSIAGDQVGYFYAPYRTPLFWGNFGTTEYREDYPYTKPPTFKTCDQPILEEREGKIWGVNKTATPDNHFLGCYFQAGVVSKIYANAGASSFFLWFLPYMHFTSVWSNILGYTAMHNRRFGYKEASMSPEDLAKASLPNATVSDDAKDSFAFPQFSTLGIKQEYQYFEDDWKKTNCLTVNISSTVCYYDWPEGQSCPFATEPAPIENSPSVNAFFGYMTALTLVFSLFAVWWAQVFPRGNGAAQRPWFFVLPSYWGFNKKESNTGEGDVSNQVIITEAKKRYGDFEAVKRVSLKMYTGEVTALLGHNGAGKSTLSNMIACELSPTEGDVSVFGNSVSTHAGEARRSIGFCKQDDYLYPNLSAKEHLELFAGLRGVNPAESNGIIQEYLESVDLALVQNQYSTAYSGGMKRRLSVACATIGDAPLIILDEPTTGMDPVSRRFVWRHIDKIKEGRVILLTTHAMEEADLLADYVAVMKKGELAATGTPLELKTDHGTALQFSILAESENVEVVEAGIRTKFENDLESVSIDAGSAGNIVVNVKKVKLNSEDDGVEAGTLSAFVAWLESEESKVSEYGFSNSSLEEVFLALTAGDSDTEEEDDDQDDVVVCCNCKPGCFRFCLSGCCRCFLCPRDVNQTAEIEDEEVGEISQSQGNISSFKPNLTNRQQFLALFKFSFSRNWAGKESIGNWVIYGIITLLAPIISIEAMKYYVDEKFMVLPVFSIALMLVSFHAQFNTDREMGLFYLLKAQGLLENAFMLSTSFYTFIVQLLFGFISISIFFAFPVWRYTESEQGLVVLQDENVIKVFAAQSAAADAYLWLFGAAAIFAFSAPGSIMCTSIFPGKMFSILLMVIVVLLTSIVVPFVILFETQTALYENPCYAPPLNNSCSYGSMTDWANWTLDTYDEATTFIECYSVVTRSPSVCIPPVASMLPPLGLFLTMVMPLIGGVKFRSEPPNFADETLIPELVKAGIKCSGAVCNVPRAEALYGQNIGFMFLGALILAILGFLIVSFLYFPRGLILRIKSKVKETINSIRFRRVSKEETSEVANTDEASKILPEVIAEQELVNATVQPLLAKKKTNELEEESVSKKERNEPEEEATSNLQETNELEEGAISNPQETNELEKEEALSDLPPVLMHKLRKVYPGLGGMPPKVALNSLDLHVPRGQVLGLLGKNGAGKTTALKILSMAHEATSGMGLVAGYDVSCEQLKVFERLGNCQQFDTIWPRQSVRRHLEFFAELKGAPQKEKKAIAHSIAEAVGLGSPEVYNRHAGGLSGGMRRRLSIAISLIGAPDVLLLDEPSTGLDPSTRNSIWGLVDSFSTADRAIIITTHNMEEADTLSNRIAIVSQGSLKVVGTQQHLKDNFGSGYRLQLNLVRSLKEDQEQAISFVRNHLHPEAELETKQAKTLHFSLPRDLDLQKVFNALYSSEATTEGGINQFLLSQSSLEDVFLSLGE